MKAFDKVNKLCHSRLRARIGNGANYMEIPEDVGSKFRLIVLAGQRVARLQRGAKARVEFENNSKLTEVALQEVLEGEVDFHLRADAIRIQESLGLSEPSSES